MAKTSPKQQASLGQSLKELTDTVAGQMAKGVRPQAIIDQLIKRGWPEMTARQFVANSHLKSGELRMVSLERRTRTRNYRLWLLRSLLILVNSLVIIAVGVHVQDIYLGLFHFTMGVLLFIFVSLDFLSGISDWFRHRL